MEFKIHAVKNTLFSSTAKACLLATGLAFAASSATAADLSGAPSGNYKVDPTHAYITFSYNHLGFSNPVLSFDDFTIDLKLDNEDPTKSVVGVSIDAESVVSGSEEWTDHLTGAKFFDIANHKTITFNSTAIEAARDGSYNVTGDLTVKGASNPVKLVVTINAAKNHPMSGKPVIGLQANGELLRSTWGLGALAPHVSDEVSISITAEMGMAN